MKFRHSTSRRLRSFYRRQLGVVPGIKLVIVSAKNHGKTGWRFGIIVGNTCHVLPRHTFARREDGKAVAEERFGVKAVEYRPKAKRASRQAA